jgi:hypothetical protein
MRSGTSTPRHWQARGRRHRPSGSRAESVPLQQATGDHSQQAGDRGEGASTSRVAGGCWNDGGLVEPGVGVELEAGSDVCEVADEPDPAGRVVGQGGGQRLGVGAVVGLLDGAIESG